MSVHNTLHFRFIESYTHQQNIGIVYFYRPQRSCEGYVFTPVCHSVHRGGGWVCPSACWIHPPGQTPPADGYCYGWYASYWNAFLYTHVPGRDLQSVSKLETQLSFINFSPPVACKT